MGCDIHLYVEAKAGDNWESQDKWVEEDGEKDVDYSDRFYTSRNYDLFAILANVRNGHGFAGVKTGEGFKPISEPRGLPIDVTSDVGNLSERWGVHGHSHSWFTLKELLEYDWTQVTSHTGVVSGKEYLDWCSYRKGQGLSPTSWCGAISGRGVKVITPQEMDKLIELHKLDRWSSPAEGGPLNNYYTQINWTEAYYQSAREFLGTCLPRLLKLAQMRNNDYSSVRIVFWFDN
jgi:hypothetical protein